MRILLFFLCFLLIACDEAETPPPEEKKPELVLTQATFADLPDWGSDDLTGLLQAFDRSCTRILNNDPEAPFGVMEQAGTYTDWQDVCQTYYLGDDWDTKKAAGIFRGSFYPSSG